MFIEFCIKRMLTRQHTGSTAAQTTVAEKKNTLVLKLKEARKPGIKWTEDTVDNENMGRKSSKSKFGYGSP